MIVQAHSTLTTIPFDSPKNSHLLSHNENELKSSNCFQRLFCCKKDPLALKIEALAQNEIFNKDSDIAIEVMLLALEKNTHSFDKNLKRIITKLSVANRQNFLESALKLDFQANKKTLGNKALRLLSLEQLREMVEDVSEDFEDVQTLAKEFQSIVEELNKYDIDKQQKILKNNSKQFFLFRVIANFFRTIATAFNLINLGKSPSTYFEAKYMLDIYWAIIDIPVRIVRFIFEMVLSPIKSAIIVVVGAVVTTIVAKIFSKIFKCIPTKFSDFENLSEKVKNGDIVPYTGREKELDEIIFSLAANTGSSKKHPLLVGKSGVGKSKLMEALTWRIAQGDVPDNLKNKQVFIINSKMLEQRSSPFSLQDPLQQLMETIEPYKKDLILIFDEAHNLVTSLGDRFNSLLDTSSTSIPLAIGITTEEDYKAHIETHTLDRRFKKISILDPTLEQSRTMLRQVGKKEAPEIKISKRILDYIDEQVTQKLPNKQKPDISTAILTAAIQKIRQKQRGDEFHTEMGQLVSKKAELISKLSRKNLNAKSLENEKIRTIRNELRDVKQKIREIEFKIEEKIKKIERYKKLKETQSWHENWLYEVSASIVEKDAKEQEVSELTEKMYLFNTYFLLPQIDKFIIKHVEDEKLDVRLTQEVVDEVINGFPNNEPNQEVG